MATESNASAHLATASAGLNCAIPIIPLQGELGGESGILDKVDKIIDHLQTMVQLNIPTEFSTNIVSIIVGSYMGKMEIENPMPRYPRNHECPALVCNLLENPGAQFSPSFLEHILQQRINTININQYMFLIDPMYSHPEYEFPHGLAHKFPSIMYNPIIGTSGSISHDNLLPPPIKYNSHLEPFIIPANIDEAMVDTIIAKLQSTREGGCILINVMDCTSNTLRRMWMQNDTTNVYLAMPDCLTRDDTLMYMPIITYQIPDIDASVWSGYRWLNWNLDKDLASVYEAISPHSYQFLIHNYKRIVLEIYFMPICKILGRMRVSLEYNVGKDKRIKFDVMSFQEFRDLWIHEHARFADLFISYMDEFYKWNYYKFIDILLADNQDNSDYSSMPMQTILIRYLEKHLAQLKAFFPTESIPDYTKDDKLQLQSAINQYLNLHELY
jgi:hypothetical protein